VSSPQFPGQESLQSRVAFVHQTSSTLFAEIPGGGEVLGLLPVEDVALAVVRGGAAGLLVAERGAALDGKSLVGVDECLAD